jgi:predicted small metal-binding protein
VEIFKRFLKMPTFKCKDIGMECKFEASAKTHDELLNKIATHAASTHNLKPIPPETMAAVKKAIKN